MSAGTPDPWEGISAGEGSSYPGTKAESAAPARERRWAWRLAGRRPAPSAPVPWPADPSEALEPLIRRARPERGAMQLLVFSFPGCDPYRRQFERETEAAAEWGAVRLVDRLFLFKDSRGDIAVLPEESGAELSSDGEGSVLRALLGARDGSVIPRTRYPLGPVGTPGVTSDEVWEIVEDMRAETGLGLALFGQLWSDHLVGTLKSIGGSLVALSPLAADDAERIRS